MPHQLQRSLTFWKSIEIIFIVASFIICCSLMLLRVPGIELLETSPNWLLIWLIAWSLKQSFWYGAIAGLAVGWIYDGITSTAPSHVIGFTIVGVLTAGLQKQKYTREDFISVAFIVFFMTVVLETIFALQYLRTHWLTWAEVIPKYREIVMVSATITSLWSPIFYYPFNLGQQKIKQLSRKRSR